jgi:hypothetical protein
MILEALTTQITQRFQHEKRACVCLWFDEKREFMRVLPGIRKYLERFGAQPFELLEYDAGKLRGQIWLKHRIHQQLADLAESERNKKHFLVYLPLSEDRLDAADGRGEHHLELLE